MVQMENEYGSFALATNDCTQMDYLNHLRDFMRAHLSSKVLLYTTDGDGTDYVRCGSIPEVYPTVDFGPSTDPFMINFRVADMEALLEALKNEGIEIVGGPEEHPNGKFAWILDPEGRKIELWEPVPSKDDPYL